jgi:uncharacterized protein (TIGR00645 family)
MKKLEAIIESIIFASRWLQLPLYLGLMIGSVLYSYKFLIELIHLCQSVNTYTEAEIMLGILSLVDITMVANLLLMVIVGGYSTFVSRIKLDDNEDRPDWLDKVDAGTIKVKLALSLISISGIHLLRIFIDMKNRDSQQVMWQIVIHCVFLLSAVALAWTDKMTHKKH